MKLSHLRLLLLHIKGAQSFDDLRTVDGVVHNATACFARAIIEDDDELDRGYGRSNFVDDDSKTLLFVRILRGGWRELNQSALLTLSDYC